MEHTDRGTEERIAAVLNVPPLPWGGGHNKVPLYNSILIRILSNADFQNDNAHQY